MHDTVRRPSIPTEELPITLAHRAEAFAMLSALEGEVLALMHR